MRRFGVLRHAWWVCAECGCASRDHLARAPRDAWFAHPDPRFGERERAELDGWFTLLDLAPRGAVLDVGGGPGFAAAHLAGRPGVERVVLLEYSHPAVDHARRLGVEAYPFDFDGADLTAVVAGPFDLFLVRYAMAWCADAPRFVRGLAELAAPGAHVLVTWALPNRGSMWVSAHEAAAPAVLWSEAALDRAFLAAGWRPRARFVPSPPLAYPHGGARALVTLPQVLRPHPLPLDLRQAHAGRVYERT